MLLWKRIAAIGAATSLLAAAVQPPEGAFRPDAAIRYTEYGIPHIVANDTERYGEKDILASPSLEAVRVSRR
ncbi:hypothetical protein BS329_16385 [Amycolatopsis coloradensis]|uniref:Uncharacterized protein n=1 Tax=Amycolatopsis coloradensis TaxID=76021 RepID=A0A1R0KTM6_9PSEU|nr:hypothetical protein [Amycolatopsis coloradensis]OLZ51372.1 hypothetical protein BS329_16385 [Amycolatopsis coloradensis]